MLAVLGCLTAGLTAGCGQSRTVSARAPSRTETGARVSQRTPNVHARDVSVRASERAATIGRTVSQQTSHRSARSAEPATSADRTVLRLRAEAARLVRRLNREHRRVAHAPSRSEVLLASRALAQAKQSQRADSPAKISACFARVRSRVRKLSGRNHVSGVLIGRLIRACVVNPGGRVGRGSVEVMRL